MKLNSRAREITILFLLLMTTACASVGLTPPQSVEDRIQYGKAGVASVYKSIAALATADKINKTEGKKLLADADSVSASLNVAQLAYSQGDAKGADATLSSALLILQTLQLQIEEKKK